MTPCATKSTTSWSIFDFANKAHELSDLQIQAENNDLWNDPKRAQTLMKRIADLKEDVDSWRDFLKRVEDGLELANMEDESLAADLNAEIAALEEEASKREIQVLLSGRYDRGNSLLTINAGAGGTDSQDWGMMLQRMYLRWSERRGFKSDILDLSEGEEAGIKSVTISIQGPYAFGNLRAEKGVHRLVRLSPFDSAHRRHTSFAQVEVLPEINDDDN